MCDEKSEKDPEANLLFSKAQARDLLTSYGILEEAVQQIASVVLRERRGINSFERFTIEGEFITLHCEEPWQFGGHEEYEEEIPLSYLWTDYVALEREKTKGRELAKQRKEEQERLEKEKKDRAKYEELRTRFEGASPMKVVASPDVPPHTVQLREPSTGKILSSVNVREVKVFEEMEALKAALSSPEQVEVIDGKAMLVNKKTGEVLGEVSCLPQVTTEELEKSWAAWKKYSEVANEGEKKS